MTTRFIFDRLLELSAEVPIQWIDFHRELGRVLTSYQGKRAELVSTLRGIESEVEANLLSFGAQNDTIEDVDPITVVASVHRTNSSQKQIEMAKLYRERSELAVETLSKFYALPEVPGSNSHYFNAKKVTTHEIDLLWSFFSRVLLYRDMNDLVEDRDKFSELFDEAIAISTVATGKVTMSLYYYRPDNFFALR